ncbi:MAG: 1-aminocyclopropane-1-carboxylate deaminase/D-cysteine desulfhydrase [Flavobacteriia bacterium]|nr:1-aminocyclopropane-1-carboxylate deaminase/D-cysteine desulfhydrase [Flavobacteriia bacterium]OIP48188.1 MAG: 1-aminocyclopropane-1-carboxylate deaminase [Flavobacteriaceae bacterium CG2_30_31_66]PIV97893.1 MAG: 1-aminocyclopropane-1-carboxylate deaminase [Flavobacteriaceae bacterium CG17_big_fil_post_rev_8_21_14_2_50_31_13]PIY14634.1 MAG: 1-aminocyclopropane-1-carboxylate deaminase [Flavobacteriaceae bacterium CG_4_10_14_3_um_filter_31_253]PIZ10906.1 MAG: 1-aminocyclopropane-1-carboxylate 
MLVRTQQISLPILEEKGVELCIKREDEIHPFVSGNKFRKLKYNLLEAQNHQKKTILTFGGAFSNHIVATAVAGKIMGFNTIGVIRGDELVIDFNKTIQGNSTLQKAQKDGMKFEFVSREDYKTKTSKTFLRKLKEKFGDFYLIPEGGTNELAIKGCEEILTTQDSNFDYICCAIGTGGTIAGLINASLKHQKVIGFPALKGDFLSKEIEKYATKNNWYLQTEYHFGGYAKYNSTLIRFINEFKNKTTVLLDPVYTSKMLFGLLEMIKNNNFEKGTKILVIHTGGLQGISGFNKKIKNKNEEIIFLK